MHFQQVVLLGVLAVLEEIHTEIGEFSMITETSLTESVWDRNSPR